jgi:hypothetical protein
MYKDVVATALKKRYPKKKSFTILEDNDPTGNYSKKGIAEKIKQKLTVLSIPKRSPDLNVLDYAIWSRVDQLLRKQERNMSENRHESRAQFEKRLDQICVAFECFLEPWTQRVRAMFRTRAPEQLSGRCSA